mmetsp:Transcript_4571/g.6932  ORF Transcript_4571/g.6932 Transcript_4571/m.6932 type:complete len:106 (+) Transcript_4571:1393-1710(+)
MEDVLSGENSNAELPAEINISESLQDPANLSLEIRTPSGNQESTLKIPNTASPQKQFSPAMTKGAKKKNTSAQHAGEEFATPSWNAPSEQLTPEEKASVDKASPE